MLRLSVAAGLVCLSVLLLWSSSGQSGEGGKEEPVKVKGQLPQGWRKIGLGSDQVQKIYTIQTDYRTKIQKLETQVKQLRDEERAEMFKVLTDDQKDKLRKLIESKLGEPAKDKKDTADKADKDKKDTPAKDKKDEPKKD